MRKKKEVNKRYWPTFFVWGALHLVIAHSALWPQIMFAKVYFRHLLTLLIKRLSCQQLLRPSQYVPKPGRVAGSIDQGFKITDTCSIFLLVEGPPMVVHFLIYLQTKYDFRTNCRTASRVKEYQWPEGVWNFSKVRKLPNTATAAVA